MLHPTPRKIHTPRRDAPVALATAPAEAPAANRLTELTLKVRKSSYNRKRIQKNLTYLTPVEYECGFDARMLQVA
jgi:hypothetical protein